MSRLVERHVDVRVSYLDGHHRCPPFGWTDTSSTPGIQHPNAVVDFVLDLVTVAADTDDLFGRISSRTCRIGNRVQPVVAVENDTLRARDRPLDEVHHPVGDDDGYIIGRDRRDLREVDVARVSVSVHRTQLRGEFPHVSVGVRRAEVACVNNVVGRFDVLSELVGEFVRLSGNMRVGEDCDFHATSFQHRDKYLANQT